MATKLTSQQTTPPKAPKTAPKSSKVALKSGTDGGQNEETETVKTESITTAALHADVDGPSEPEKKSLESSASKEKKWSEIRLILEKIKDDTLTEIRKAVKKGTEAVAAIEPGGDIYDQASSERDRELGLLLGDREREKIHSIDEALLRIDEGDYGVCEECDEEIPLGRLKAMPFARHCVKCKTDIEKLQAQTKRVEEERAYREIPLGGEEEEG
jgi:DnaK suppressor protein